MMEERKKAEIEHYDKQAEKIKTAISDFEGFSPLILSSYKYCYNLLREHCKEKKVLDYGCGNGIHSFFPLTAGAASVVGIDLSEKALEIAREKAKSGGFGEKAEFLKMDCEKTDFPDNTFDVIFDGGTFSSLDIKKALPELSRILKPTGYLIGIETFGHNPLTNLKREINKRRGRRTAWAASHILRMDDLQECKKYFGKIETAFFHLFSWIAFPFLTLPLSAAILNILESIEKIFLRTPLKRYAFKVVFLFSNPKK